MYVMTLNIFDESIKTEIYWESLSQPPWKLINLAVKRYIFRSKILKIKYEVGRGDDEKFTSREDFSEGEKN